MKITAMGVSILASRSAERSERNVPAASPSLSPTVTTALRTDTEGFTWGNPGQGESPVVE